MMQEYEKEFLEVKRALALYKNGVDPNLIELSTKAVFPHLISAAPSTARKARVTGILMGRTAPQFVKHGRAVRYRLSTVLAWICDGEVFANSALYE